MNLKKTLGFISEKYKNRPLCESCGDEFICGAATKDCWCINEKLSDEIRKELKLKFNDCLCQNCLEIHTLEKQKV